MTESSKIVQSKDINGQNRLFGGRLMGFIYMDPGNSLPGFIMKQKQIVYYGVNKNLPEKKYAFASFHEAFHGICGHLSLAEFHEAFHGICGHLSLADFTRQGAHADTFENHKVLALTEREANIGAADTLIETDLFLEMSGYDSEDVKAYTNDAYCGTQRYRGRCLSCIAHFSNELLRRFPEVIRYTFWLKFADNMV